LEQAGTTSIHGLWRRYALQVPHHAARSCPQLPRSKVVPMKSGEGVRPNERSRRRRGQGGSPSVGNSTAQSRRKRPSSPPAPSRGGCGPLQTFITAEADDGETARNSTNIRSGFPGRSGVIFYVQSAHRDMLERPTPRGTDQRCEHQVRHHARSATPNLARSSNFSTFPAGFRGSAETISNRRGSL